MMISLIVAMAENRVIGKDNELPWHLPDDLKWFKKSTLGKPIIMGRKTWESIGRPLPGRRNIVVSRNPDYHAEGCETVTDLNAVLASTDCLDEVVIIGGAGLYEVALPFVQRIYLTRVHADVDGDTYFPEFDEKLWNLVSEERHEADARHAHAFTFQVLNRNG